MSDGSLSQDEIDALLQGGGGIDAVENGLSGISEQERNDFQNLLSGIVQAQSANLSGLITNKNVSINIPALDVKSRNDFLKDMPEELVGITINYSEGLKGEHLYVLKPETAIKLASLIVGQKDVELNEMALEALKEAMSQITGTALTAIGDKIGKTVMPEAGDSKHSPKAMLKLPSDDFLIAAYPVNIEGEPPAEIYEIFSLKIVKEIVGKTSDSSATGASGGGNQPAAARQQAAPQQEFFPQMPTVQGNPNVRSVQYPTLQHQEMNQDQGNIGLLMDVFMEMTVELGRTKKSIKEILGMGEGTIIELDKLAGEPVDILVNHKLIAKGEVVVIDENFGVRVTDIISSAERLSI